MNNRSSVLVFTPWYRPDIGGIVEVADRLFRLLNAAGVETTLLVHDESARGAVEPDRDTKGVWRLAVPSGLFYRCGLRTALGTCARGAVVVWRLVRFLGRHRVRAVVVVYPGPEAWPFLLLRWLGRIQLILSCHGRDVLTYSGGGALSRRLLQAMIGAANGITVTAPHLAEEVQRLAPRRMAPVALIPNCVDTERFAPAPAELRRRNGGIGLVHVSNFTPKKRTSDVVRAFARAALPADSRLVMVGAGPELDATRELAQRLGVAERVEFAGPHQDVRSFLWQADILVMASDEESGPLVILEAMACGVPWVATPWGVVRMIPAGECGLVVPCRDPDRLASAITRLGADPRERRTMAQQGRQRAVADFGTTNYVARHLALLAELCPGVRVGRPGAHAS